MNQTNGYFDGLAYGNYDPNSPYSDLTLNYPTDGSLGNTGVYQPTQQSGFSSGMGTFAQGAQAVTGLAGAHNAYKLRGLAEDQFAVEKDLINLNIRNQSLAYNDEIRRRATAGLGLQGINPDDPRFKKRLRKETKGRKLSGRAIA